MPGTAFNGFQLILGRLALAVILLLLIVPALHAAPKATGLEISGDAEGTVVTIDLDEDLDLNWFLLRSPYRLVVELPETAFAFDAASLKARGLVNSIRYGKAAEGRSRIILTGRTPFAVERVDAEAKEADQGYRLVVELEKSDDRAFQAAMAEQSSATGTVGTQAAAEPDAQKPFIVVLDPGHGGFDGGAEGVSGTNEKDITLAFAQELKARLALMPNYKVIMTRDKDIFLRLDERVKIAQENRADLFISIHADTIRFKGLRGATVYTGSERASDAESQALADRENLADQIGDAGAVEENHEVADILFDFVRRETQDYSVRVAKDLVGELAKSVGVINNPHRHARFRVLRAPDVPSVLVELGYLSNVEDESSLRDPQWRAKAVDSIALAVEKFGARKGIASAQAQR